MCIGKTINPREVFVKNADNDSNFFMRHFNMKEQLSSKFGAKSTSKGWVLALMSVFQFDVNFDVTTASENSN